MGVGVCASFLFFCIGLGSCCLFGVVWPALSMNSLLISKKKIIMTYNLPW